MTRLIIAGGGLAGCLAALALNRRRTEVEAILVEQQQSFGGIHTWSYFHSDVAAANRWIIEDLVEFRWADHEVHFPGRSRILGIPYNSLSSTSLDRAVKSTLHPRRYRLGSAITDISSRHVTLKSGERIEADVVIDARGGSSTDGLDLGFQKFVGQVVEFRAGHNVGRPIIMDATVEQHDGYRFLYFLPLDGSRLLIEDTYYSLKPALDIELINRRITDAAQRLGAGPYERVGQESGVLPVVLDGDFERFWPKADDVPRLGVRGGYFHPTTSYSLPDAVATVALLVEQKDFTPEALVKLMRGRAKRLWQERAFYRLLNRMLFRAVEPNRSYKILEHFYRLPEEVIARFYAARLTSLDKVRIVSGRPPVPLDRALRAMWGSAA